jgi:hypothetical protein
MQGKNNIEVMNMAGVDGGGGRREMGGYGERVKDD